MSLKEFLKHIGKDNTGATAVEYGLIVALIVIAMIGALQSVANVNDQVWSSVENASNDAVS